ncbi:MAG TPA: hypothetical protein VHR66_32275 [Gemmataceae bacterium]|jgi:uncharacterized paraquat-inducible protein A|nr:hypothetical protein [Gemmataceae bacterium]
MPRRVATEDDWDEDDDEGWTPDDDEEWVPDTDDDNSTVECPHCHEAVFDQAEQCPHCGWYISEEDAPPVRRPPWIIIGFALALFVGAMWIFC